MLTMCDAKKLMVRLTVVVCLSINLAAAQPEAAQSSPTGSRKISSDLIQRTRSEGADTRVKVVVQFNEMPATLIDGLLSRFAARVTRKLSALNMRVIELPVNAVEALASQKEVRYLSPDRPIDMLGHVETTTGTAAVREQTNTLLGGLITTPTVFDGSGIAIAIVDSGINAGHSAFRAQPGL